ncbi:hypothetical protein TNCV_1123961 [Trichonephila clavipes]|uniref:Uncharacterized protein n=1 Tax=Trichonephila clavipes TaxID=2585209 RepID=A0A8X6SCA5_TRICX|nr:hypothetical protein TNCV_1123961 [Trichonephila clavipes]
MRTKAYCAYPSLCDLKAASHVHVTSNFSSISCSFNLVAIETTFEQLFAKWCSISVHAYQQKRERNKEIILDVHLQKQKNWRVIFQCGDGARLTSEHIVLCTATLHPQIGRKIGSKSYINNVRVIRPLGAGVRRCFGQMVSLTRNSQCSVSKQVYQPTEGMCERLCQPCPSHYLNPGPMVWNRDALPLSHWAIKLTNECNNFEKARPSLSSILRVHNVTLEPKQ